MQRFLHWLVTGLGLVFVAAAIATIPVPAKACECVPYAIEALKRVRFKLKTVPNIAVNDWHKHPGAYSRGVVNVRDINNCRVLLHEFVHHGQYERHGDAQDIHEWQRRELQAAMITMLAESEMEACDVQR